jgi:hypothetical protein
MERAQVPYFLGGSLATSLQGEPRSTNDIDFVVDLRASQVRPLIDALGADFDVDEESLREAVAQRSSWNIDEWAGRLGVAPLLARAREEAAA